jgi:putative Mn2+ efflux pump MntP
MFLFVGMLIGLNLMVRVALGETRERQSIGHARGGRRRVTLREAFGIALKSGIFLVIPMIIGQLLDIWFDSTVGQLFD